MEFSYLSNADKAELTYKAIQKRREKRARKAEIDYAGFHFSSVGKSARKKNN